MRNMFRSFYFPTDEEYAQLWKDGLIVIDANVLLDLYRLPPTSRSELLSALELVSEKIWVPHQAALEFHRNRAKVVLDAEIQVKKIKDGFKKVIADFNVELRKLELDKRVLTSDFSDVSKELDSALHRLDGLIDTIDHQDAHSGAVDATIERLNIILDGKIGNGPNAQSELDILTKDGEIRFTDKIPPGFLDESKEHFFFDGMKFNQKYGDLILWRQTIDYSKQMGTKCVLFITGEKKEDWWRKFHGRTIGPLPALIDEIRREAGVDLFWAYSVSEFLKNAHTYAGATVTEEAVKEAAEAERARSEFEDMFFVDEDELDEVRYSDRAMQRFLEVNYGAGSIERSDVYPDYIFAIENKIYAANVLMFPAFKEEFNSGFPTIEFQAKFASNYISKNSLAGLVLILIVSINEFSELAPKSAWGFVVEKKIKEIHRQYANIELILATEKNREIVFADSFRRWPQI